MVVPRLASNSWTVAGLTCYHVKLINESLANSLCGTCRRKKVVLITLLSLGQSHL